MQTEGTIRQCAEILVETWTELLYLYNFYYEFISASLLNIQEISSFISCVLSIFNPIALRTAKTLWGFGRSECNRVKPNGRMLPRSMELLLTRCYHADEIIMTEKKTVISLFVSG